MLYTNALKVAVKAHRKQKRRDWRAYVTHPIRVANNLKDEWEKVQAVALLHDVVEDTYMCRKELLEEGIPNDVIDIVMIVTKRHNEAYDTYIWRVLGNEIARKVKIADIMDNLWDDPSRKQIDKYVLALEELL